MVAKDEPLVSEQQKPIKDLSLNKQRRQSIEMSGAQVTESAQEHAQELVKIKPVGNRSTEDEISRAVEVCCWLRVSETCPEGGVTFRQLKSALPDFIELTPADREILKSRPAEQRWHAILRNIGVANYWKTGNAVKEGRLIRLIGGGYALGPNSIYATRGERNTDAQP